MKKGRIGAPRIFLFSFGMQRSPIRDAQRRWAPFRTVDTAIRPRIPIFRSGVEPRAPEGMSRPADIPGSS